MSHKKFYFISGLPRSGSTLLSAILNQNPEFYADIKSPVIKISKQIIDILTESENSLNFDENRRKSIINSFFNGYYSFTNSSIVFDSSRDWTANTSLLQSLFPYTKIICCVRDIGWILDSYERIFAKNPFHTNILVDRENCRNVFSRCDYLMRFNHGSVMNSLTHLHEGVSMNSNMIKIIEYKDLCKNPEKTVRSIYDFMGYPYYKHDFNSLEYSIVKFFLMLGMNDINKVRKKLEWI